MRAFIATIAINVLTLTSFIAITNAGTRSLATPELPAEVEVVEFEPMHFDADVTIHSDAPTDDNTVFASHYEFVSPMLITPAVVE